MCAFRSPADQYQCNMKRGWLLQGDNIVIDVLIQNIDIERCYHSRVDCALVPTYRRAFGVVLAISASTRSHDFRPLCAQ